MLFYVSLQRVWLYCWHVERLFGLREEEIMKRRNFLLFITACFAVPKSLFAKNRNNDDLVLKNGWILKKEDL